MSTTVVSSYTAMRMSGGQAEDRVDGDDYNDDYYDDDDEPVSEVNIPTRFEFDIPSVSAII